VKGVSTTKVGQVIETLTGSHPSASTVSRVFHTLESEYEQWKTRKLSECYVYAFADGTYFTVIYNGEGCKMPILAVVGIAETGEREVLADHAWVIEKMSRHGKIYSKTSKGAGSRRLAYGLVMATKPCWVPSRRNFPPRLGSRVWCTRWTTCSRIFPPSSRTRSNRSCVPCSSHLDRQAADQAVAAFIEKYRPVYPTAIACLQRDLEACLTFYSFPKEHWKTIRTNNVMERLFGEVKRRSHKMAAAFRTEESCLLLFYAVIRSLKFNKLTMSAASQAQPDPELLHNS
jgi:putative transposase